MRKWTLYGETLSMAQEPAITPYEKFLRQSIEDQKKELDQLYNRFAHAHSIEKRLLKSQIDKTIQNIDIVQKELQKYVEGLAYLREPSKIRDQKAENLGELEETAPPKPQAQAAAPAAPGARPVIGRPVIGKPVGQAIPAPVPKPAAQATAQANAPTQPAAKPPRPVIGKPIGQPLKKPEDENKS